MSHEATELRREINALEQRRDSLRLRATFVEDKDPDRADLYDEWADAASDEISRLRRDLYDLETHENLVSMGRGYNGSEM